MTRVVPLHELDMPGIVRAGDTVLWTQAAGEPTPLVERLLEQRHRIGPFRVFLGTSYSGLVRPEHADTIGFFGSGAVGTHRDLWLSGKLDVMPSHLTDLPRLLACGALHIDVALLQLSALGPDGPYSLGAMNSYVQACLGQARTVIGEVNEQAPWSHALEPVSIERFDILVPTSHPLVEIPARPVDGRDRLIAEHISRYVRDEATLQIGLGTIPNALFEQLRSHKALGLHTGVVGDGVVDLIERGVITNAAKAIDTGQSVTGGLMGTRRLYDFVHRNPSWRVEPVTYTHDPSVLARLGRFTAINSALEVDLTGQANAEVAGHTYVGTVGGQTDFIRAAFASPGGRSVIGLPARTDGGRSRIVARIDSGVVTASRADADVVVTEYGAAELRGQPICERVRRLVAIAHPEDRDALEHAARSCVVGYQR